MHAVSACTLCHKELVLPHAACFVFFLPSCFHVFLPHALSSKQVEVSFNGKSTWTMAFGSGEDYWQCLIWREAAFVLFVGPTMKKFHDRDLPCDEWAFAKALSYTSSFVHKGWLGIELLNKLSSQAAVGVLFARMQLIMQQLVTRIAMASSRWRCSLERGPLQYKFQAQRAWPCMISDFTCQQLAHVAQTPSTCHAPQSVPDNPYPAHMQAAIWCPWRLPITARRFFQN